ncbi:hypothetical protein JR316_0012807 [Psilocybe cubensis]|uniref:Uncharacterized protein n=2 Tax=Psilocybe cubensis TaxID=181762 RepID=A0A8H7XQ99_PSICU|nr:hypothetical protein JR316_0012807 [Psilocybe cubensis]KAH9474349.1 hypothetical protein JR316_0012807 [Psilocybe cubensis]
MPKGFSTQRAEYIRSIRAQAHKEGTIFKVALEESKNTKAAKAVLLGYRTEEPPLSQRNIRGWYSDAPLIDDGDIHLYEDDIYDFDIDLSNVEKKHETDRCVSIMDLARPAKRKGVAKDFEMVKNESKGKLLDGEDFEIWEDDLLWEEDWEKIYNEDPKDIKRSYSAVLRGYDT